MKLSKELVVTLLYGVLIGVAVGVALEASGALSWLDRQVGGLFQHKEHEDGPRRTPE